VNERRARGLFLLSLRSMLDILPGAQPQIRDVRQTGSTPSWLCLGVSACRATWGFWWASSLTWHPQRRTL